MTYNQKNQLQSNIQAVLLAKKINDLPNYKPSEDELLILNQYKGFGGIKCILFPMEISWITIDSISKIDLKLENEIKDFYSYISENFDNFEHIWSSIKESVLTSFYTPDYVVDLQVSNLYSNNPNNIISILDPCAGSGAYIDSFLRYYPDSKITGVEKDYLAAYILSAKYRNVSNVTIINKGFEEVKFREKFDFICSNIPFGNFKVKYKNYDNKITGKIHNFFFYHSMKLLNEGGALSLLTSTGVLNSPSNKFLRSELAKEIELLDIVALPKNVFIENGAEVSTHIFQGIRILNPSKDQRYIETLSYEGVLINEFIYNNFDKVFLKQPQISTDPYGKEEFNYLMEAEEIPVAFRTRSGLIPQLSLVRISEDKEDFIFQNFPFPTFNYKDIDTTDQLKLLRNEINTATGFDSYKSLAIISANYKGKEVPLFTVAKFNETSITNGTSMLQKKYVIDVYSNIIWPQTGTIILTSREFKITFDKIVDSLQNNAKNHSLLVDLNINESKDGDEFSKYFYARFNQPLIYKTYQYSFDNFSFHKEPVVGMLALNRFYEPARIFEINDDNQDRIFGLESLQSNESDIDLIKQYLLVYDAYNLLLNAERNKIQNIESFRERLNVQYDMFVSYFGFINDNKKVCNYDSDYFSLLKSLENFSEEIETQIDLFTINKFTKWVKADIFFSKTDAIEQLDVNLALAKSYNSKGKIDIDYISGLSNLDTEQVVELLKGKIVKNPLSESFELRSLFFSGNIKDKIRKIEELKNPENDLLLTELSSYLPTTIPFESINIQLGSRWFPQDLFKIFLKKYFEQDFSTNYNQNLDNFFVTTTTSDYSAKYRSFNYECHSGRYIYPTDIIYNAFYDLYPIVTYKTIDDISVTDEAATKYYKREITKLRKEFLNFIYDLSLDKKTEITQLYNDKFNNIVIASYDTEILDFSDFDIKSFGIPEIYEHQKRAPWKMISNEGGIGDHEVGLGKTFTIAATAHFGKKLSVFKKPVIIGIKANVSDLATAYRTLLPASNVLFASHKEFTAKERETFLNRIRNNNYDVVIMSHEQFSSIPQDPDVEKEIVSQELTDVEANLLDAKDIDISKKQLKGLEIRKKNLDAKLEVLIDKIRNRKDENVLSFSDLGIDHIIVDESHKFKNLMYQTKHTRVAGLGNTNGSQRANNLLTALRTIQKNTKSNEYGASFFSGTPISNSITELYLLQKYLTPKSLKERGIYNFDAWCSNFAEKTIDFETNMINQIIAKERFRYFINLPELSLMYNQMADVMTGELAKIDRPQKNEFLMLNEQTPLQKRFYVKLKKFLENKDQSILGLDKPLNIDSQSTALSLVAMNLAFKASIDMRLISARYPDETGSKVNLTVKELVNRYYKESAQKTAQIVFVDISTPKKKYDFEELEENYKNNVFTSIYDDIKFKLIKSGVPEAEIAFIQDYNTEIKKSKLSKMMNNGEIRILIGGTENAGTGLNVQYRLSFINHLSIPWKPAELDQRNGRGFRTGNWFAKIFNNNKIDIGFSVTKNTLDNYKIDINKNKAGFIKQIKGASIGLQISRRIDEGSIDENTGMSLAELQAQLTGDNTMLLKTKVDNQIKELEQDQYLIISKNRETVQKIESSKKRLREYESIKVKFQFDYSSYKSKVVIDEKGNRVNKPIYFELDPKATNVQIYEYLKGLVEIIGPSLDMYSKKVIGELFGFEIFIENHSWLGVLFKIRNKEAMENSTRLEYSVNEGKINLDSVQSAMTFFIRSIDTISSKIKNVEENIEKEVKAVDALILSSNQTFNQEEKLSDLKLESELLEQKIKNSSVQDILSYETKSLVIDNEEKSFKIISDLETLDKAILNEHLGEQQKFIGIFCNSRVRDILNEMSELEMPGFRIESQNLDFKNYQHFMKILIYDYDIMYCCLDSIAKKENLMCLERYNILKDEGYKNVFVSNDSANFYSYNDEATKFSEILGIPVILNNGNTILKISNKQINQIKTDLNVNHGIEISLNQILENSEKNQNLGLKK